MMFMLRICLCLETRYI